MGILTLLLVYSSTSASTKALLVVGIDTRTYVGNLNVYTDCAPLNVVWYRIDDDDPWKSFEYFNRLLLILLPPLLYTTTFWTKYCPAIVITM